MFKNIFEILEDKLLSVSEYKDEDGKLIKAKVIKDLMSETISEELLELLLSENSLKSTFFQKIGGGMLL